MDFFELILEVIFNILEVFFPDLQDVMPTWIKWSFVFISIPLLIWVAWVELS